MSHMVGASSVKFGSFEASVKDSTVLDPKDAAETKTVEPPLLSLSWQSPSLALPLPGCCSNQALDLEGWPSVHDSCPPQQWWV